MEDVDTDVTDVTAKIIHIFIKNTHKAKRRVYIFRG